MSKICVSTKVNFACAALWGPGHPTTGHKRGFVLPTGPPGGFLVEFACKFPPSSKLFSDASRGLIALLALKLCTFVFPLAVVPPRRRGHQIETSQSESSDSIFKAAGCRCCSSCWQPQHKSTLGPVRQITTKALFGMVSQRETEWKS